MNKHSLKHLLLFISCLFFVYSCVSEEDIMQTEKTEQEKKTFAIFSQSSNIQGKSNKSAIDYANGFSILMQRYDSIHNTNISGLVNTTNIVEHKKNSLQNVIVESKEFYIENRLHSQTIFEENGDIWVMYPKIKNNSVEDLLIASYTDNGTNVFFRYVKKDSELYVKNVKLFQEKFDEQINRIINNKSNSDLCGYGDDVCELDLVIIIGGGSSSGCVGCESNPPLNPGSGCEPFVECIYNDLGGGGGDGTGGLLKTPCKTFDDNNNSTDDLLNNNPSVKKQLDSLSTSIKTDTKEKAFIFAQHKTNYSVMGSYIKTGTEYSVNFQSISTNNSYNIMGAIHTHPNSFGSFSTGDYYTFHEANKNNSYFNSLLALGPDGSLYLLSITDYNKFINFTTNYPKDKYFDSETNNWKTDSKIGKSYEKIVDKLVQEGKSKSEAHEIASAYILNKFDTGISISKKSPTDKNFKKMQTKKSSGSYTKTEDCLLKN